MIGTHQEWLGLVRKIIGGDRASQRCIGDDGEGFQTIRRTREPSGSENVGGGVEQKETVGTHQEWLEMVRKIVRGDRTSPKCIGNDGEGFQTIWRTREPSGSETIVNWMVSPVGRNKLFRRR